MKLGTRVTIKKVNGGWKHLSGLTATFLKRMNNDIIKVRIVSDNDYNNVILVTNEKNVKPQKK